MNRRHFIQLSGTALGSLLVLKGSSIFALTKHQVQLPLKAFVKLDDGVHELTSSKQLNWNYKDITVHLQYAGEGLQIKVQSPTQALHQVTLKWQYALSKSTTVMGDHWERTYGDLSFEPATFDKKLPWYFVQHDGKDTTCFGVRTGCNTLCHWQIGNGQLQLTMDTRSAGVGVQLGDRILDAAEIVATKQNGAENTFATARRFCSIMSMKPRLPLLPVYGINDWYFAYGNNSSELILQHTAMLAELASDTSNLPFSVVDAGWATYSPAMQGDCCWQDDYTKPNDKFKDMHKLSDDIKKLGMRPGLWIRPLCASYKDDQKLLLPFIPGRNSPQSPILDPTIEENLARVKGAIALYKQWGYDMVKHDFTTYDIFGKWGFEMKDDVTTPGWRFNDNRKTTAEVILTLYRAIREAAGDTYLIGCNTVSHLSAGLFELNRIGDDTSGKEWDRTRKMGVNTLGFRMIQHNTFYAADGDCVGLTNEVPWAKNKQWMELLAESSSPLFISAQPDAVGEEQRKFIKQCFATAAKKLPIAEPIDWLTNQLPKEWKLDGSVKTFDWT